MPQIIVSQQISDKSLCGLAESAHSLRELCVGCVYGVTDYGVSQLAYKCPTLELLDVSYCHRVSNAGLEPFLIQRDIASISLKHLRIKACHKVRKSSNQGICLNHRCKLCRIYLRGDEWIDHIHKWQGQIQEFSWGGGVHLWIWLNSGIPLHSSVKLVSGLEHRVKNGVIDFCMSCSHQRSRVNELMY